MSEINARSDPAPKNSTRSSRLILWLVFILTLALGFGYLGIYHGRDMTATGIIGELRNLKAAVTMYRADNPGAVPPKNANNLSLILQYLKNPGWYTSSRCAFVATDNAWWVGVDVLRAGHTLQSSAAAKRGLAKRAGETNFHLHGSSSLSLPPSSAGKETLYTLGDDVAWMWVYLPEESGDQSASTSP